jgi:hypothetical protein
MTFSQILASLTTAPAERFGASKRLGRVAPGLAADLTILRNDPSKDIRALAAVQYTIRDGKVIYRSSMIEPNKYSLKLVSQEGIVPADAGRRPASRGWVVRGEPVRAKRAVVSLNFTSWNQLDGWLRQVEVLRRAA